MKKISFFFLFSIWEKFLAGSEYIFVFLTIHILHHCRLKLLSLYSTKEIMQYLVDLKVRYKHFDRSLVFFIGFRNL
jgi:hypothetical protein